jgi:hypothetical protein
MVKCKYIELLVAFVSQPEDKPDITHFGAFHQCCHTSRQTFMTDQYLSISHFVGVSRMNTQNFENL